MVDMIYINDKEQADKLKKDPYVFGVDYLENLADVANKIANSCDWECFDAGINIQKNFLYYNYQHKISHCNAIINADRESEEATSIRFSFVEKEILKETLKEMGLPVDTL